MGSIISSHGFVDENLRIMIREYTVQSIRAVEESWKIYVDELKCERYLTYEQFDEVFGMLIHDTVPHFEVCLSRH